MAIDVERIGRVWQRRLRLQDWAISFTVEELDGDDGEIEPHTDYDEATVRISPSAAAGNIRNLNVTIVHELVHAAHRNLDEAVDSAQRHFRPNAWSVWSERVEHEREHFIEKTAQILVDAFGVVEREVLQAP